ncbi:MAG TPA: efflux RND transporter periplasmic adaptor subunit [Terriglobales bacterium]|jgi:RND family efflux transporter MFP subunit|nr:efflux RND transporter periplasmic adaptor subunit [Terriglobales bacterium]
MKRPDGVPIFALVLSLAATLAVSGCARSQAAANPPEAAAPVVGVSPVAYGDLSREIVLTAEFRPYQEVAVHAKVAGYVRMIRVDVGDRVTKGELLARLEIPELRDEIQQADATVRQDQAELQRAQAAHEAAHLAYARLQGVVKVKPTLVAQQEIDDAAAKDRVTEAQISAAQQQLQVAQANRDRLQTMYAYSEIVAPFTGVVTKRFADTGALIQAGTASETQSMPLVTLSQNDLLRLIVPVPESDVPQIHLGTPVTINVPSLNKTIKGKVARFADTLDLDTRTMDTEIDVPNPSLEVVPGMYAQATIALEQRKNVLTVPVEAVEHHGKQAQVYVVDPDGAIREQTVQTGLESPSKVEIVSGVKANDLVVVSGRGQLRPGEKVQPKQIQLPAAQQES